MARKDRERSVRDLVDGEEDSETRSKGSSDSEEDSAANGEQADGSGSGARSSWDGSRARSKTAEEEAETAESDATGDQVQDLRERMGLDRGRKIINADYSDEIKELGNRMEIAEHKGIPIKDAGKITDAEIAEFIKELRLKRETDLLGIDDPKKLSEEAKNFIQKFIDNPKSVPPETRETFLNDVVNLNGDLSKWTKPGDGAVREEPPSDPAPGTETAPEESPQPAETTPQDTQPAEEGQDTTTPTETQQGTAPSENAATGTTTPTESQQGTAPSEAAATGAATPAESQQGTAPSGSATSTTETQSGTAPAENTTNDAAASGSNGGQGGTYDSGSNAPQGGGAEAPADEDADYYYSGWVNTEGGGHTEGYYYQKDGVWYDGNTGEEVTDQSTIGSLNYVKAHPGSSQGQQPSNDAPPAGEAEGDPDDDEDDDGQGDDDDDDDDDGQGDDDDDDDEDDDEEGEGDGSAEEDDDGENDGDGGEAGTPNPDDSGSSDWDDRLRFWETPIGAEERKREQDAIGQRKGRGVTDPPDEDVGGTAFTIDPRSGLVGVAPSKQPGGGVTDPPDESVGQTVVTAYDLENLKMWSAGGPAADPPEDSPQTGPRPEIDPRAPIPQVPVGGPGPKGESLESSTDVVDEREEVTGSSTDTDGSEDQVNESAPGAESDGSTTGAETGTSGSEADSDSSGKADSRGTDDFDDPVGAGAAQSAVSALPFQSIDVAADLEVHVDEIDVDQF